eukprot:9291287-Karenia_brevis.AAC.1
MLISDLPKPQLDAHKDPARTARGTHKDLTSPYTNKRPLIPYDPTSAQRTWCASWGMQTCRRRCEGMFMRPSCIY